jgi:isoaspartyl peptidase/L-asparaginase-like protein (Ntn-hydrolase superfamily)
MVIVPSQDFHRGSPDHHMVENVHGQEIVSKTSPYYTSFHAGKRTLNIFSSVENSNHGYQTFHTVEEVKENNVENENTVGVIAFDHKRDLFLVLWLSFHQASSCSPQQRQQ